MGETFGFLYFGFFEVAYSQIKFDVIPLNNSNLLPLLKAINITTRIWVVLMIGPIVREIYTK